MKYDVLKITFGHRDGLFEAEIIRNLELSKIPIINAGLE